MPCIAVLIRILVHCITLFKAPFIIFHPVYWDVQNQKLLTP